MTRTGVVLLAAGSSQRFGNDKRLAAVSDAADPCEPMLLATIRQIQASGLPLYVVLRTGDHQWQQELDRLEVAWGASPEAQQGMGHSLASGIRNNQDWDGWLIALADMPYIQPRTYRAVADALQQHAIVQPVWADPYSGQYHAGHPLGFDRSLAFELLQCSGDNGACHILRDHAERVFDLISNDAGILQDIDRPEDLHAG